MKNWMHLYHDEGDNGGTPPQTPPAQPPAAPAAPTGGNPDDVATALLAALEKRTQRVESSVTKSFAEQHGMSEAELTAILDKVKTEKAKQLPEAAQKQIAAATEKANGLLVTAEVKSLGASMGLVDADAALLLMERKDVKVGEDGAVTGVKEALEALKTTKPYLFGKVGAMAQLQQQPAHTMTGVEAAFYRKNPTLKSN